MKINIGEIEVNYELAEDEKNILTNEEQEYYKFINEKENEWLNAFNYKYLQKNKIML